MVEKKYQIFVSSTYGDLKSARNKVIETVLKAYHLPVGMEMFSADDADQWKVIKDTIDLSDYYVVIIGHRYGSVTLEGISYTEKEYDYAREQGVPILAFIRDRGVATTPEERDGEPDKERKLEAFIEKAKGSKMCDFWKTEDDLSTQVALALWKIFPKYPRTGWIRADQAISVEVSDEMARLSRENRDLREEKERLEAQLGSKKPDINVSFSGQKEISLPFKTAVDYKYLECPSPISVDDIPSHLKNYVSAKDIDEYNKALPSSEDVDKYNKIAKRLSQIESNCSVFSVDIINSGSAKANLVIVEIEFPDEIYLGRKKWLENIHEDYPKNLVPTNPIQKAEFQLKLSSRTRDFEYDYGLSNIPDLSSGLDSLAKKMAPPPPFSTNIEGGILTIKLDNLLHTRQEIFRDFVLAPLSAGEFLARVGVICEEYSERKVFNVPIHVSESENLRTDDV